MVAALLAILKWAFVDAPEIKPFESKDAKHLQDLERDLEKCIEALEMIYEQSDGLTDNRGWIAATALDTLNTYDWGNR